MENIISFICLLGVLSICIILMFLPLYYHGKSLLYNKKITKGFVEPPGPFPPTPPLPSMHPSKNSLENDIFDTSPITFAPILKNSIATKPINESNSIKVQDTKEHYLIRKDEVKKLINMMLDRPRMFAQSPESMEDQVLLLVKIANPGVDIWSKYQFFKKDYIELNAPPLSSKYTFDTTPSISDLLKKFVNEQYNEN